MRYMRGFNPLTATILVCVLLYTIGPFLLYIFIQEEYSMPICTVFRYEYSIRRNSYDISLNCSDSIQRVEHIQLPTVGDVISVKGHEYGYLIGGIFSLIGGTILLLVIAIHIIRSIRK